MFPRLKTLMRLTNIQADRVVYATQTTLSLDDTQSHRRSFESNVFLQSFRLQVPTFAMRPRIARLPSRRLPNKPDLILVVGAENSSNSNRLVEVAQGAGVAGIPDRNAA